MQPFTAIRHVVRRNTNSTQQIPYLKVKKKNSISNMTLILKCILVTGEKCSIIKCGYFCAAVTSRVIFISYIYQLFFF